jgi:LPS-assembly protein
MSLLRELPPNRGGVSCKIPGLMLHFNHMNGDRIPFCRLILTAFFCLAATRVFPQTELGGLTIKANKWERKQDVVMAWGNVEIHYKNMKLLADYIQVNIENKDVLAEGNVAFHLPEEVIRMKAIRINLDSVQGSLDEVMGMIQPSVYYEAESLEMKERYEYILNKARLTSCAQPVPRWLFTCSKAVFKKNDYVAMWNAVFRIKNFPVFYMPYFRYPLDQDKSTGFLMPQVGYSASKGLFYSQAFYWSMRRNMDATFNLDLYGGRGMGGGLEYRYLFDEGLGGNIHLYYFDFKENPERKDPENAYLIRVNHIQPLPAGFNLVADVDLQSSYEFLREFDNNINRALISNRKSQVYLTRSWSSFTLNARASRFETYFTAVDSSIIKNTLPEVRFSASKVKLFEPLYFSFSSILQRWEQGWQTNFEKGTQKRSQNLTFAPQLTFPFTSIPWLTLTSALSGNLTYYFQTYAPNSSTIVNEPLLTKVYTLNFDLIGPVAYRVFYDREDEPRLKHIIEPSLSYRYDSRIDASDRLITSQYYFRNHYLRYGLTNRLLIKEDDGAREVLSVGLSQSFYFEPDESPLRIYKFEDATPEYSDVNGNVRFYPSRKYSLDFSLAFNPYYRNFSNLRLAANLGSSRDNFYLRVNWYKSINPYRENLLYNRHQLSVATAIKIPSLSLETTGQLDFNIKERKLLYSGVSFVYHYQCLDFLVDGRIFYFRQKPDFQFRFSFGLGNIGKTTDFLGGVDFK